VVDGFGSPWTDVDGHGCDTRNDILRRDLVQKRILPDCTVARGILRDPLNLLAVDSKGYRCPFVARQVAVKDKYGLWVTAAEKSAIARVLGTCPSQPLPR
jgi:hypothetical protein